MSKKAQLPPRYPLQNKNIGSKQDHCSHASCIGLVMHPCHRKSMSQSFIIEEQPPWFDDLLSDQDSDSYNGLNLSSSSYSSTFLDLRNEFRTSSCESDESLESSCTYGPNSPKRRSQLTFPIISAFSDSEREQQDKLDNSCGAKDESNNESNSAKRFHPGQRRRAWKLQYISELERTVCTLQTFKSELAVNVFVMSQQRSTLQAENSKLKQQMIRLHQEKLLADGQYQSLKKEAERLKASLGSRSHMSKISTLNELSSAARLVGAEVSWKMIDLRKLDLS